MNDFQVALFAEDRNFVDFLVPATELLARKAGRSVDWLMHRSLHGCRSRSLRAEVDLVRNRADFVIVGADAAGKDHAVRGGGHRRKRAELMKWLDNNPAVVIAVADPCIEAWLYSQPNGFKRGIEIALDERFTMPSKWPVPKTESDAKDQLGRLISDGLHSDKLPRNGFEIAREIVEAILAEPLDSPSLRDCVQALSQAVNRQD